MDTPIAMYVGVELDEDILGVVRASFESRDAARRRISGVVGAGEAGVCRGEDVDEGTKYFRSRYKVGKAGQDLCTEELLVTVVCCEPMAVG